MATIDFFAGRFHRIAELLAG
jgi:hypothetical protein